MSKCTFLYWFSKLFITDCQ